VCLEGAVCEQCFGSEGLPLAWVALLVALRFGARQRVRNGVLAERGTCVMVDFAVCGESRGVFISTGATKCSVIS